MEGHRKRHGSPHERVARSATTHRDETSLLMMRSKNGSLNCSSPTVRALLHTASSSEGCFENSLMRKDVAHEFDRVRDRSRARGRRGSCKRDANQTADRAPAQPGSTPWRACGESLGASECRQKRFKWSSFSHYIQLHLTGYDRVQSKPANRPVSCKHKGIRDPDWRRYFHSTPDPRNLCDPAAERPRRQRVRRRLSIRRICPRRPTRLNDGSHATPSRSINCSIASLKAQRASQPRVANRCADGEPTPSHSAPDSTFERCDRRLSAGELQGCALDLSCERDVL